jgi:hypothetical protein
MREPLMPYAERPFKDKIPRIYCKKEDYLDYRKKYPQYEIIGCTLEQLDKLAEGGEVC